MTVKLEYYGNKRARVDWPLNEQLYRTHLSPLPFPTHPPTLESHFKNVTKPVHSTDDELRDKGWTEKTKKKQMDRQTNEGVGKKARQTDRQTKWRWRKHMKETDRQTVCAWEPICYEKKFEIKWTTKQKKYFLHSFKFEASASVPKQKLPSVNPFNLKL